MRADGDAFLLRQPEGAGHDFGVAAVESAGDIGAGDDLQHGGIVAHDIGAVALAAIAIQVDASHVCMNARAPRPHKRSGALF